MHHSLTNLLRAFLFPVLLLLFLLFSPQPTTASCACGYKVDNHLYTTLLETDFLHLKTLSEDTPWQPQSYTVTPALARGPYGKNASLENVVPNPLKDKDDWEGEGMGGGDAGLQLFVRAIGGGPGGLVRMAEIASKRNDILYGSFRATIKFTDIAGTCGAFFW
ncbi:MAG: hypothetical protein Q9164_003525, partial [Protoblastenia rupestris]